LEKNGKKIHFFPKGLIYLCIKFTTMAEIRLNIDDNFFESLKKETGINKASQLTNEALNLLKWAASEARAGRVLTTSNADGSGAKKIVIPSLENAKLKK
jgi:hypothetical protein